MSMMVSFVLSFFPRDVLDEILNLIGSVSEGFPSYFCSKNVIVKRQYKVNEKIFKRLVWAQTYFIYHFQMLKLSRLYL